AQQTRAALLEGLADLRRLSLDGTFLACRASRHRLLRLEQLDKRLGLLAPLLADDHAQASGAAPAGLVASGWMAKTPGGRLRQAHRYLSARQALLKKMASHAGRQKQTAKSRRSDPSKVRVSVTDPQAALGLDKFKVFRPLYNVQLAVDLDSPLIAGYGVYAA